MSKKDPKEDKSKENEDLKGFDIRINEFGEIVTSLKVEDINEFLNENLEDKKLKDRDKEEEE